jgi:hypothetical protein
MFPQCFPKYQKCFPKYQKCFPILKMTKTTKNKRK